MYVCVYLLYTYTHLAISPTNGIYFMVQNVGCN